MGFIKISKGNIMDRSYYSNLLRSWGKLFGLDLVEIKPGSPNYEDYCNIVDKMHKTTDLAKLYEYANKLSEIYEKERDFTGITEANKSTDTERAIEDNVAYEKPFVEKTTDMDGKTLYKKSMVPYTISANYKYPIWNYQFVTPGVTKDNVIVSYDKEKSVLSVNVLKDFAGNAYQEDIIVDTYGRDVKSIKWRVLNGVTEIALALKDRDSFSIEYEE